MKSGESVTWRALLGFEVQKGTRKEARYAASGRVAILLQPGFGDVSATVNGEFLDQSEGGCRIRHHFGPLKVTGEVAIVWVDDHRLARVIWNKCVGEETETGFQFTS